MRELFYNLQAECTYFSHLTPSNLSPPHRMQYRVASVSAIYDKSLRLKSTSSTDELSSGKVVNIASNDVERFLLASAYGLYIIWVPILSIGILALGWYVIGSAFAAGFVMLIFGFIPIQLWLSKKFAMMRSKVAALTDQRVTLVSQAVSGVRVMKMSGWEDSFEDRIVSIRAKEVDQIERVNRYRALNEAVFYVSNVATSVAVFLIHVGTGGVLTPMNVFTTMVLVNVAQLGETLVVNLAFVDILLHSSATGYSLTHPIVTLLADIKIMAMAVMVSC